MPSWVCITILNSPNSSRVYIRLWKHGKHFLLLDVLHCTSNSSITSTTTTITTVIGLIFKHKKLSYKHWWKTKPFHLNFFFLLKKRAIYYVAIETVSYAMCVCKLFSYFKHLLFLHKFIWCIYIKDMNKNIIILSSCSIDAVFSFLIKYKMSNSLICIKYYCW